MSWFFYIGLSALAGWMMGFVMGRMSQPSATLTPAELMPEQVKTLKVEKGDTIILRYPGVFNVEQREAVKRMFYERFKDQEVEVLVLEAGLDADVIKPSPDGFYMGPDGGYYYDDGRAYPDPVTHAKVKAMTRRRDDSRPHTQPEGDWEEEMPRSHVEPSKPWSNQ